MSTGEPRARRPRFPAIFGVPDEGGEFVPWEWVDARLRDAKHYWVTTLHPAGRPHPRPVDGMWLDRALWFGGAPESRWWRNVLANPVASLHLEDAEQAVILNGEVTIGRVDAALAARLAEESNRKFAMGQSANDYLAIELACFRPYEALAWRVLNEDAAHFSLEG